MTDVRMIWMPDPPPWTGREKVYEAFEKQREGDLWAAIEAISEAIGPDERVYSDQERPYVAAAFLTLAGFADQLGDSHGAMKAYDLAFERFGSDYVSNEAYPWLAESFAGARKRYDWLAEHRAPQMNVRFHVRTPIEDVWVNSRDEIEPVLQRYLSSTDDPSPDRCVIEVHDDAEATITDNTELGIEH